ncbi:hypothetical protein GCM10009566_12140 [Streptomyces murinus]
MRTRRLGAGCLGEDAKPDGDELVTQCAEMASMGRYVSVCDRVGRFEASPSGGVVIEGREPMKERAVGCYEAHWCGMRA